MKNRKINEMVPFEKEQTERDIEVSEVKHSQRMKKVKIAVCVAFLSLPLIFNYSFCGDTQSYFLCFKSALSISDWFSFWTAYLFFIPGTILAIAALRLSTVYQEGDIQRQIFTAFRSSSFKEIYFANVAQICDYSSDAPQLKLVNDENIGGKSFKWVFIADTNITQNIVGQLTLDRVIIEINGEKFVFARNDNSIQADEFACNYKSICVILDGNEVFNNCMKQYIAFDSDQDYSYKKITLYLKFTMCAELAKSSYTSRHSLNKQNTYEKTVSCTGCYIFHLSCGEYDEEPKAYKQEINGRPLLSVQ